MVLATIDVVSFYLNIPHDEAQLVVEETLENRTNKTPPTYFLMEMVDIILENIFADTKNSSSF